MERAERSRRPASSRSAAEGAGASAAAPLADHRPASVAQRAVAGWVAQRETAQRTAPEEELQMKANPVQLAAEEEELQMKRGPIQLEERGEDLGAQGKSEFEEFVTELASDPDFGDQGREVLRDYFDGEGIQREQARLKLSVYFQGWQSTKRNEESRQGQEAAE